MGKKVALRKNVFVFKTFTAAVSEFSVGFTIDFQPDAVTVKSIIAVNSNQAGNIFRVFTDLIPDVKLAMFTFSTTAAGTQIFDVKSPMPPGPVHGSHKFQLINNAGTTITETFQFGMTLEFIQYEK